jgi:hypothetical protein
MGKRYVVLIIVFISCFVIFTYRTGLMDILIIRESFVSCTNNACYINRGKVYKILPFHLLDITDRVINTAVFQALQVGLVSYFSGNQCNRPY